MTSLRGSVVINHQVFHTFSSNLSASVISHNSVSHALEYNDRDGKYADIGEFDREPTEQDRYLESMKIADEMSVDAALQYGARAGRFEGRSLEIPMRPGEVSGGCWDEHGLADIDRIREEILASGSNMVKTVVSVPREWAPALKLETKAQWQSLIRRNWSAFMGEWGIIPAENARWCAFFHTDNAVNIHVHVISWSSDGTHFNGDQQIPYKAIEPSNEVLRREVFKDVSLTRSVTKDYLREAILTRTRELLGARTCPDAAARLETLAKRAGEREIAPATPIPADPIDLLKKDLARTLPPTCFGRLGFVSANEASRKKAREIIALLRSQDQDLDRLFKRWDVAGEIGADILGMSGKVREGYIERNSADIEQRVGNIIIKDAGIAHGQPWMRSPELSRARKDLLAAVGDAIGEEEIERLGKRALYNPKMGPKTFTALAWRTIYNDPELSDKLDRYAKSVVGYSASQSEKAVSEEQSGRLESRARGDIARSAGKDISDRALKSAFVYSCKANDCATLEILYGVVRGASGATMGTGAEYETVREIQRNLQEIRSSMKGGKINEGAMRRTVDLVARIPGLENALQQSAALMSRMSNGKITEGEAYRELLRGEKELISAKVLEICEREELQSRAVSAESAMGLIRCALMGSQGIAQSPPTGIKSRALIRHRNELSRRQGHHREPSFGYSLTI